jgi:hypothetical protein
MEQLGQDYRQWKTLTIMHGQQLSLVKIAGPLPEILGWWFDSARAVKNEFHPASGERKKPQFSWETAVFTSQRIEQLTRLANAYRP